MAAIFGEGKIFGKLQRVHSLDTLWVENFDEIALSHTVKEIVMGRLDQRSINRRRYGTIAFGH